jgi:multicomponent K+:H+ antiporter subunit F
MLARKRGGVVPIAHSHAPEGRPMSPLLPAAILFAIACYVLAMALALVRLLRGPSAQDRVLALDFLYVCGMLLVLVLGVRYASTMYFEAALLIALFGFVGTASMAKFLLRGEVIE